MSIDYENLAKCCFTGYRPDKFPFPLSNGNADYKKMENALVEQILELASEGCRTFYCGMAMGFDLIAGETVLALKNAFNPPLKLVAVLPFSAQSNSFTDYWKEKFENVLKNADEMLCLSDEYYKGCFQTRNIFMVDNSDYVITWYDGKKGGTANTLQYAHRIGRQIFNINRDVPSSFEYQIAIQLDIDEDFE